MAQQEQLLTPKQVADILNVSQQTLWNWRQLGKGPAYVRLGNSKNSPVRYLPLTVTSTTETG